MVIDTLALHGVKYIHTIIINDVIHNFKQVAVVVKAHKQVFVSGIIPNIIINSIFDGVSNSGFTDAMLKGRRVELNDNIHCFILANFLLKGKGNNYQ